MIAPFPHLACPLDGQPLQAEGGSLRCASGHAFDVAAEGHVHLLPVQFKRSKAPGDDKAMVAARRRFLQAGHYAPLAQTVARCVSEALPGPAPLACLDAGCGEGYYLRQLGCWLGEEREFMPVGLDISKWAVQSAARQGGGRTWVVGSNARLPILPESLDAVLCLFGFPVAAEFARVLRPGGLLLQLDPGPQHLRELREILYPSLHERSAKSAAVPAGFAPERREWLSFDIGLDSTQEIADLLIMTPHLHRATPQARAQAFALSQLRLTVEVCVQTFRRLA